MRASEEGPRHSWVEVVQIALRVVNAVGSTALTAVSTPGVSPDRWTSSFIRSSPPVTRQTSRLDSRHSYLIAGTQPAETTKRQPRQKD